MSSLLSIISRSTSKNIILNRQLQNVKCLSILSSNHQPTKTTTNQLNKSTQNNISKLDAAKLIKSTSAFSTDASAVHDHSRLWTLERGVSAVLIGIVPLALIAPNPYLDYALALSLVVHVHWGIEAIVVDYVRPKLFGPIIPKLAIGYVYLLSILTLAGLYYFNYNDVGLSQAIMMFLKK